MGTFYVGMLTSAQLQAQVVEEATKRGVGLGDEVFGGEIPPL